MQNESPEHEALRPPEAFRSQELAQLYAYWHTKRGQRTMPAWADLDPLELKFVLGNVFLLDVTRNPLRFRYRVYAGNMARNRGYDLTGKFVDDIPDRERRNFLLTQYTMIVETHASFHAVRNLYLDHRRYQHEILALPLSSDDALVDKLLVGVIPYAEDDVSGTTALPQRYGL